MSFMVSEEVTVKEGGPRMIVTGYSSGMVECRWYDGYGVKREAFHETELVPGEGDRKSVGEGKSVDVGGGGIVRKKRRSP